MANSEKGARAGKKTNVIGKTARDGEKAARSVIGVTKSEKGGGVQGAKKSNLIGNAAREWAEKKNVIGKAVRGVRRQLLTPK